MKTGAATVTIVCNDLDGARSGEIRAIRTTDAAPIRGLKPRMVYTAQVHDYFAAAIALLQGEDKGLLMTAAFQKAIQQAANKKAAYMGERFELPGCSKVETPASR